MTTSDHMEVLEIEKRLSHQLFYFQDSYIYPLIKQELLLPNLVEHSKQYKRSKRNLGLKLKTGFDVLKSALLLVSQRRLKHYDLLFIDSASSRRYIRDGISHSVFCDFIIRRLPEKDSLLLELPSRLSGRQSKIASPNIYYPDLDFIGIYMKMLFAKRSFDEAEQIVSELERFGVRVSKVDVNRLLRRFMHYSIWADRVLRRTQPSQLILVCSYTYLQMALIRMSRRRGIPVIELQHGQISGKHYGYIYSRLENRDLVPDYFFANGAYYKEVLEKKSVLFEAQDIFCTGNLFLEEIAQIHTEETRKLVELSAGRKIVFISSQITTRDETREMTRALADSIPDEVFIIYKPHPNEADAAEFYSEFQGYSCLFLVDSPEYNSLDLLKISDVHITVYSTVFMEAYYFRVPTFFYQVEPFSDVILEFIDGDFYRLIQNPEEMAAALLSLKKGESREIKNKIEFYKADPWESFEAAREAIES